MLPKTFLEKIKLRNKSFGVNRRLDMSRLILDHAPNFPLSVELKDIDAEFERWVEEDIDISFDGSKLPTFKLFSNQRINEYAQTWNHLDQTGNLLMNFKTITRDNNPKKGTSQGEIFNIPGDRDYPMFIVPVLQENGSEAYDMYSMKQPFSVDIEYTLGLITNKYELLNMFNQLINDKFKAISCYIYPNQHPMSMELEDISDESEYSLDDRKYYSQTYKIKVKAYIIRESDYTVTRLPSRVSIEMLGVKNNRKRNNKTTISKIIETEDEVSDMFICRNEDEESNFKPKEYTIEINIPTCEKVVKFISKPNLTIEEIELNNVYSIAVSINEEYIDLEDLNEILGGDKVHLEISRDDDFQPSKIIFKGKDYTELINEVSDDIIIDSEYIVI